MSKILIVEDDIVLSKMYAKKFELAGYKVVTAYSGQEGITQAKNNSPDCILLDIMMPVMDGFTVMKELKKESNTSKIPVVILTNLGTNETFIKEGLELGAKEFLIKYKTPAEKVVETVKKYIK